MPPGRERSNTACVALAEGDNLDGKPARAGPAIHQLDLDHEARRRLAAARIFSRSRAPTRPLIRWSVRAPLVAPSM